MGAALAANTGAAGAMHRVGFFAAKAAPTLSAPPSRHAQDQERPCAAKRSEGQKILFAGNCLFAAQGCSYRQ
ncbi:protein of unknown function [Pseudomonas inefficax]|uniref:Uncharacterized protein n=1 Tax=Pseudomonas inefficax TaxID=2078786 RepID=A0AAQ1STD3_9PSED|nr:protein of unknown function [Pseudomonas inefficax]